MKKYLIIGIIVLVGICVGVFLYVEKNSPIISFIQAPKTTDTATQVGTDKKAVLIDDSGDSKARLASPLDLLIRSNQTRLSYDQAVDLYKEKTVTFGADCQIAKGSTTSFVYNNEIMLDNKDIHPIFVQIGDLPFALGPRDFAFLILKQKGPISVDCNDKKNVMMLQVQ
ncbi:MAG: hypothetical protein WCQ32_01085 [bacterium]